MVSVRRIFLRAFAPMGLAAMGLASPASALPEYDSAAPIAYLIDASSGAVLLSRDADRRIPPASMAKMMTVYVAFDQIKRKKVKLSDKIVVDRETWTQWNNRGSTMFLKVGEPVSIEDLLDGVVTVSGNDASVVLAQAISGSEAKFTGLMNSTAKRIGLKNSRFGTANGWPDEGRTYVTARDLAHLARRTVEDFPDLYRRFYSRKEYSWNGITQPNRDPLFGRFEGADGLKTGHTEEAGYCFTGSAERDGRRLFMVVAGLGSTGERVSESVGLMRWGFDQWTSRPLLPKDAHVGQAEVQMGDSRQVTLIAPRAVAVTLPAGDSGGYKVTMRYQGPLRAPIEAGQRVGELIVRTDWGGEQRTPLVAATSVGEAGPLDRIWNGLMSFFG